MTSAISGSIIYKWKSCSAPSKELIIWWMREGVIHQKLSRINPEANMTFACCCPSFVWLSNHSKLNVWSWSQKLGWVSSNHEAQPWQREHSIVPEREEVWFNKFLVKLGLSMVSQTRQTHLYRQLEWNIVLNRIWIHEVPNPMYHTFTVNNMWEGTYAVFKWSRYR